MDCLKAMETHMFVLTVAGMTTPRCVQHVTNAIHSQDSRARVEVKLGESLVYVETKADLEKIKRALENDGYRVQRSEPRP